MPSRTSSTDSARRITEHPVLTFRRGRRLRFWFEGRPLYGFEGDTIAAALVANDIKVFRHTAKLGRARGLFCAVGKCSSCLMTVNGLPNTMVCMEPLRAGARVERQEGRGKLR